ncbi:MAG: dephospho-CoA kinase [Kiritimatiellaeota bacterium]|nr:dephospho-CoA kinase [Kiritimatiellota bacterium]
MSRNSDQSGVRALRVAVTGGLACGKTEVARMLGRLGAAVWEADAAAHRLLRRGTTVYGRVVRRFGPGILRADGEIDRGQLGRRVFAAARERRALNALVHPGVIRALRAWLAEQRRRGRPAVAVVPLLFEAGLGRGWDAVVCVATDGAAALRRLRQRGLSARAARQRLQAQWPLARKIRRADVVLWNKGTRRDLAVKTRTLWSALMKKEK